MIFKKISALLTFLWAVSGISLAQTATQNAPLDNSLLWEISGKGIKKPSYLFGTIHMLPADSFFMPTQVIKKLKRSKCLTAELDLSQQLTQAIVMMAKAPMRGGKQLKDLLPEADYQLVKTYFDTKVPEVKMMGFKSLESWKPMLLSSMLYPQVINSPIKSYEMELLDIAEQEKLSFAGLETLEQQMAVFDSIPYNEQAEELLEMVKSLQNGSEMSEDAKSFMKMVNLYRRQNIEELYKSTLSEESTSDHEDILLAKRNRNWIPKIIEMASRQSTFFAVGAGHLAGETGVIRLLRKAGYQVTPILR